MNMTKWIVTALALCLSLCTQANQAPESSAFFAKPDMTTAKLSPNGKFVATIRYHQDKQRVMLFDVAAKSEQLWLDLSEFSDKESSVRRLVWIDNDHLAAQFYEKRKGQEDLLDSKTASRLLIFKRPADANAKPAIYTVRTPGTLVHSLPEQKGQFLYAKMGIYSKVYRLNVAKLARNGKKLSKLQKVDGGQFRKSNEVAKVSGYASRWFINPQGEPTAVMYVKDRETLALSVVEEGKASEEQLSQWKFDDENKDDSKKRLMPIAQGPDKNSFYALDHNEENQRTVYLVNFADDSETVVYQSESFEILDVDFNHDSQQLNTVKVLNNGKIEHVFLNSTSSEPFKGSQYQDAALTSKISTSVDDSSAVYYLESHNSPGRFVLKQADGNLLELGSTHPALDGKLNSRLIESSVTVEGLEIPTLLTLPQGAGPHPLIVKPHGGPIGIYDGRYFESGTEYLAAQGFAVLRVNFRGSSGYSSELEEAGKKQWGKLMLEDLYQATLAATAREDIDGAKVCAYGASYGGYASLMLTIKHPELYKCAVSFAGVTDFNLQLNSPTSTSKQRKWKLEHLGDAINEYEENQKLSPVYLAEQVKRPLFIYHGEKDRIVDIEHAWRLKLMLDKHGKDYQFETDPEGEHSLGSSEKRTEMLDKVTAFVKQHL